MCSSQFYNGNIFYKKQCFYKNRGHITGPFISAQCNLTGSQFTSLLNYMACVSMAAIIIFLLSFHLGLGHQLTQWPPTLLAHRATYLLFLSTSRSRYLWKTVFPLAAKQRQTFCGERVACRPQVETGVNTCSCIARLGKCWRASLDHQQPQWSLCGVKEQQGELEKPETNGKIAENKGSAENIWENTALTSLFECTSQ